MNILHGFTGSVASRLSYKFGEAYTAMDGVKTKCVHTESSKHFGSSVSYNFPYEHPHDFEDSDEWSAYKNDDTVLHIDLIKWADIFVIAPLSANTLAKLANGICDNLLTCCARAWNFDKPLIVAPSMNTRMWEHPITKEHTDKIRSWGIRVIDPIEKELFCGDVGNGAMANIDSIITEVKLYKRD